MDTKLIEAEIKWCEENKGAMPEDYTRGFIAGLKQTIFLISATKQRITLSKGGNREPQLTCVHPWIELQVRNHKYYECSCGEVLRR